MDVSAATLIGLFDRIGIVAFAFAGVDVGLKRRFDLFGLVVIGVVTAAGGGLLRDVILGRVPLILVREDYLVIAVGASLAAVALVPRDWRLLPRLLAAGSALGLGAFTAAGALAAISAGLPLPAVIIIGILTATGGGVLRDLLADRVPLVLTSEVNASASAVGALTVWLLEPWSVEAAAISAIVLTAALRFAATKLDLHLPVPGGGASRKPPPAD